MVTPGGRPPRKSFVDGPCGKSGGVSMRTAATGRRKRRVAKVAVCSGAAPLGERGGNKRIYARRYAVTLSIYLSIYLSTCPHLRAFPLYMNAQQGCQRGTHGKRTHAHTNTHTQTQTHAWRGHGTQRTALLSALYSVAFCRISACGVAFGL